MKSNRWTAALAAAGIVTAPSLLHAQTNTILAALSSTTLSGYVDTSAQWNLGTGNANVPHYSFGGAGKADGFNLNVVDLALDKPLDESEWAAGYHVELWFGPDARALGTASAGYYGTFSDFAIRQAYVALRTPIGNGINWKLGVWDTIIGYEGPSSPNNPNYTRSYGFTVEPTTHTGLLGTYLVNDQVSVSAGIANTFGPTINGRATSPYDGHRPNESFKTYMASVTFTAPTNWGWLSGSTLSGGVINGFNSAGAEGNGARQTSVYLGTTLSTPISALKLGASLDYVDMHDYQVVNGEGTDGSIWAGALYASYQATEKLTFNLRGEFLDDSADLVADWSEAPYDLKRGKIWAATATAQYDLWKNVLSRIEFRWDHADNGKMFGANTSAGLASRKNACMFAANIIYKF